MASDPQPGNTIRAYSFSANSDSAVQTAWLEHINKLDKAKRERFESFRKANYDDYLAAITEACTEQRSSSVSLRVASWFKPLFDAVDMYMPYAVAVSQAYPNPSSIILGGISCVMQTSSRFVQFQDNIAQHLSKMGRKIQVFQQYDDQAYQNLKVKMSLVGVLGAVLDFCSEAQSLVINAKGNVRGGLKIWSLSLFVSFESKFQRPLSDFDNNLEDLKENAAIAAHKRIEQHYQAHEKSSAKQRQDAQNVEGFLSRIDYHQSLANVYQERLDRQRERKEKEKKKLSILQWFPSTDFPKTYEAYCKRHHEGTGQWFRDRNEYKEWKSRPDSNLLWCKGNSGCGKSVLAALAITDLKISQEPGTALAYVYCDHMDPAARDAFTLGSTLLKQLIREDSGLNQSVESLYDRNVGLRASGPVWGDMEQAILSVVHSFKTTFIVADGLDELHDTQQRELARLLCALTESTACVKVLVLSRPDRRELETSFSSFNVVRTDTGENDYDITDFIKSNITQDSVAVGNDTELLAEMQLKLTTQAGGSFLWANETIQNLKAKTRPREVAEALEYLPIGMEKHYEASLLRVLEEPKERRELALDVIFWAVNVYRPLSKDEMLEAISVTPGMTSLSERDKVSFSGNISSWCGHLVILDAENNFILRHTSASDYLKKTAEEKRPNLKEYWSRQMNSSAIISRICLTYLLFDEFACGPVSSLSDVRRMKKQHPLLSYATANWASHLKEANVAAQKLACELVTSSQDRRDFILQIALVGDSLEEGFTIPKSSSPLHVCALFGLDSLADTLPSCVQFIDGVNSEGRCPLDYALEVKSLKMTYWLLKKNIEHRKTTEAIALSNSPMHTAARYGWTEVINLLIKEDYRVDVIVNNGKSTPLHYAADEGHVDVVASLLDAGADVNRACDDGRTPLMYAVGAENAGLIRMIIRAGADINASDQMGVTALFMATMTKDLEALTVLLGYGAAHEPLFEDPYQNYPLQEAAGKDFTVGVQLLLDSGAEVNAEDRDGYTALNQSAANGSLSAAQTLLQAGADAKLASVTGVTPLHNACSGGHLEIAKLLCEQKGGLATLSLKTKFGRSPLHEASSIGHLELVQFLVDKGADVDSADSSGDTPLLLGIGNGHEEVVKFLLERKADIAARGFLNGTALHCAADRGRTGLFQLLIGKGVDINAIDDFGDTALHLAAEDGTVECIKSLVLCGSFLDLNKRNLQGRSALHRAAKHGHLEVVRLLLEQHAEVFPDSQNQLPIHHAVWSGHEAIAKIFMADGDINVRGYKGRTALYEAASMGYPHLVEILLDHGADANLVDDESDPPIIESCRGHHTSIVNLLLDRGADALLTDKFGTTLLHAACRVGDQPLVERLLDLGCDGLTRDQFGDTPFAETMKSGNVELSSFLAERGLSPLDSVTVYGDTCFHVVAELGDAYMLTRLLELDPAGLTKTDGFNRSLLHIAAQKGHTRLASALIGLGLSPEALSLVHETPFYNAVESRAPSMVDVFLASGEELDLNIVSVLMNNTPMTLAAASKCPQIVKKLLQAGADPSLRNWFGMNAMDYALLHPPTREVFENLGVDIKTTPRNTREFTLLNTIVDTARILLAPSDNTSSFNIFMRFYGMLVLGRSLLSLSGTGDDQHDNDALPFVFEQAYPPEKSLLEWGFLCSFCGWDVDKEDGYFDITCFTSTLCVSCHKEYLQSDDLEEEATPRRLPLATDILQDLEATVQPLREAVKDMPKENLVDIVSALNYFAFSGEWLEDRIDDYERWEKRFNVNHLYSKSKRPGGTFIKILETVRNLLPKLGVYATDEGTIDEDVQEEAAKELKTQEDAFYALQREHVADVECQRYQCVGHKYFLIEIDKRNEMCKKGEALDEKGQVTDQFLRYILEKYKQKLEACRQGQEKVSALDVSGLIDLHNRPLSNSLLRLASTEPAVGSEEDSGEYLASMLQETFDPEYTRARNPDAELQRAESPSGPSSGDNPEVNVNTSAGTHLDNTETKPPADDHAHSEQSLDKLSEPTTGTDSSASETSTDDFSNINFAQAFGIAIDDDDDDDDDDADADASTATDRNTKLLHLALKLADAIDPGFSDGYWANKAAHSANGLESGAQGRPRDPAENFMNDRTSRPQAQGYLTGLVEKALWMPRRMIWGGDSDDASSRRSRQGSPEVSRTLSGGGSERGAGQQDGGPRPLGEQRLLHEHFWAI